MGIVFGVGLFRSDSHGMLGHSQSNDGAKKSWISLKNTRHFMMFVTQFGTGWSCTESNEQITQ